MQINQYVKSSVVSHLLKIPKSGFTLAEVLVTLGILGVVAAVTMPTLIQGHQKKVYVTQLKKVYSEMEQAFLRYKTDRNALNLREAGRLDTKEKILAFYQRYFNVVSTCTSNCFEYDINSINGTKLNYTFDNNVTLASGAIIWTFFSGTEILYANFLVDTNGAKGPNVVGRDVWTLAVDDKGKVDDFWYVFYTLLENAGAQLDMSDIELRKELVKSCPEGSGCFNYMILDNWEMKY